MPTRARNTSHRPAGDRHEATIASRRTASDAPGVHKPRPVLFQNFSRFRECELVSEPAKSASAGIGNSNTSKSRTNTPVHTAVSHRTRGEEDTGNGLGNAIMDAQSRGHGAHRTHRDESGIQPNSTSDRGYSRPKHNFCRDTHHADEYGSDGVLVERTIPKWVGEGSRKLRKGPPEARMLPPVPKDDDLRVDPSRPLPRRPERKDDEKRKRRASKCHDGPIT